MCQAAFGLWLFYYLFYYSFSAAFVSGATNVTVDDADNAINYSNSQTWKQGATCADCFLKPDASQAFDGTWHDCTSQQGTPSCTITFTFTGTAVYVYFIVAESEQANTVTFENTTFMIDGQNAGDYFHVPGPSGTESFLYNFTAFATQGLQSTQHTLVMATDTSTEGTNILFDYLVYTTGDSTESTSSISGSSSGSATNSPTSSPSTSSSNSPVTAPAQSNKSSSHVGAIVGGVIGGVVFFVLLGLLVFCIQRRRRSTWGPDVIGNVGRNHNAALGNGPFVEASASPFRTSQRPNSEYKPADVPIYEKENGASLQASARNVPALAAAAGAGNRKLETAPPNVSELNAPAPLPQAPSRAPSSSSDLYRSSSPTGGFSSFGAAGDVRPLPNRPSSANADENAMREQITSLWNEIGRLRQQVLDNAGTGAGAGAAGEDLGAPPSYDAEELSQEMSRLKNARDGLLRRTTQR